MADSCSGYTEKHALPAGILRAWPVISAPVRQRLQLPLAGAIYFVAVLCGLQSGIACGLPPSIHPAAGFGFAMLTLRGGTMLPVLMLADFCAGMTALPPLPALALAAGNTAGIALAWQLMQAKAPQVRIFDLPRHAVLFICAAPLVQSVTAATAGTFSLTLVGIVHHSQASTVWGAWTLAQGAGFILSGMAALSWTRPAPPDAATPDRRRLLKASGAALLLCLLVLGPHPLPDSLRYLLLFIIIPATAWAGFKLPPAHLSSLLLAGGTLGAWLTHADHGVLSTLPAPLPFVLLQGAMLLLSAMALMTQVLATTNRHMRRSLSTTQDAALFSLASLAETRDNETGAHIMRTQAYVRVLARQLRTHVRFRSVLTPEGIEQLCKSAPLHDIGKVGVPDAILRKQGPLTPQEMDQIKLHTVYGRDALRHASMRLGGSSFLQMAEELVHTHHECWDGTGYPQQLTGEQIPVAGRLMALADVYDALISRRCYKKPVPHHQAREIILKGRGTRFDPAVVDAFLRAEHDFLAIAAAFRDEPDTCT
ncbi:HD domain-containing phosphohydrolase [Oleidesulfovibrio alaskensis]|uniref:HD domain-containing phosphohydrolase n=1 Tax=Oleidesulfovibrio alaskensis TaxID=58180 RepID=UPI00040CE14F|nr:HD domain-containing phosphohydrolase [Oleidesulfovibrio alaskensis]